MDVGTYPFSLGRFRCVSVRDGSLNYPLETFFANVPRQEVVEALQQDHLPTDYITTPYTCLFVDTGRHRVLIDTGAGDLGAVASKMFPNIDQTTTVTGQLLGNLTASGIEASTVDTVIVTHAHPDHVGGTLDDRGNLLFGHAHYFVARAEWEFWTAAVAADQAPASMVEIARRNLESMRERLTLVEDGDEIVPGIRVVATPGHTPGHIALEVDSGDETLLHISDVVLHPLHLEHPAWLPVLDLQPDEAAASKRRTFDRAAAEELLVFAHHFPPFPNLGRVRKQGSGWQWQPIQPAS